MMTERRNDPARLLACLFVILTGCRPVEAVRLKREFVDLERGKALLYEHKTFKVTGKPKVFFITDEVKDVFRRANALHELRGAPCAFVFPRRDNPHRKTKQKASIGWPKLGSVLKSGQASISTSASSARASSTRLTRQD